MKDTIEHACCCLQKISGYPFQAEKDIPFLQDLLAEFPSIDLLDEIKQWKVWLLDNMDKVGGRLAGRINSKKINYRSRLRRWCSNASKWKNRKEGNAMRKKSIKKYTFESEPSPGERNIERVW